MFIFSEEISDIIQHVSLGLEALGLTLTYIEVKYPDRADRIEIILDELQNAFKISEDKTISELLYKIESFTANLFVLIIFITGAILFNYLVVKEISIFERIGMSLFSGFLFTVIAFVPLKWITLSLFLLILALLNAVIRYLNKKTNGRALGGVGIIIAFIGFIGEIYQIFTIYLD